MLVKVPADPNRRAQRTDIETARSAASRAIEARSAAKTAVAAASAACAVSTVESDNSDLSDRELRQDRLDVSSSINCIDPSRVEGKRLTAVDDGDVVELELKYKPDNRGSYKGKVLKFYRSRIQRLKKRDSSGKIISTNTIGGELMIEIEWLDAPAVDASKVIGKVQQLQVTDFLADYTVKSTSHRAAKNRQDVVK